MFLFLNFSYIMTGIAENLSFLFCSVYIHYKLHYFNSLPCYRVLILIIIFCIFSKVFCLHNMNDAGKT